MIAVPKILQCPLCKTGVSESLVCQKCGEKYAFENDVYVMVNKKLSGKEWKWDQRKLADKNAIFIPDTKYYNPETVVAEAAWFTEMKKHVDRFSGLVGDVATGMGGLFNVLMSSQAAFTPVATDVDPNVLAWTSRKMKGRHNKEFISVATDGKHFAFTDESFDIITSLAGFQNIPKPTGAYTEMYRALKPGGRTVFMNSFVDKWSKSYWLAKLLKLDRACIKDNMLEDLTTAGFTNIRINIVSSAVYARNPNNLLPVAGDRNHYAIVEAGK